MICFQDYKDREVYAFLFPLAAIGMGGLYFLDEKLNRYFTNILINLLIVLGILGILWLYARFKLKKELFKEAFGLGDVFMLVAMALGFPVYTFTVLLSFGFITALIISLITFRKQKEVTIPLAGQLSVFLVVVYMIVWVVLPVNLYVI